MGGRWWLAFLIVVSACVRTNLTVVSGAGRVEGPLLVLVSEGTFGTRQAEHFAAAMREACQDAGLNADVRVVGASELRDDARLVEARAGKAALLRVIPIAGTRLVGEVTRVTYDASLYRLPGEERVMQVTVEGQSGALARQLGRRDRRMARAIIDAFLCPQGLVTAQTGAKLQRLVLRPSAALASVRGALPV